MMERILVTGIGSGLGRYLFEEFRCLGINRNNFSVEYEKYCKEGVDVIIHCALNSCKTVDSTFLYNYIADNVLLTEQLTQIPHKKFIYLSTIDVYKKNGIFHNEEEKIIVDGQEIYALTKLMSDCIVQKKCKNFLILRPTALLGKYSRESNLIKLIKYHNTKLTVTDNSMFNCVAYDDVKQFIEFSIIKDVQGIFNFTANGNIAIKDLAKLLGKAVIYGNYYYDVGMVNNEKILKIFPQLNKNTSQVIESYIKENEK